MRHFLSILDTPAPVIRAMLRRAVMLRRSPEPGLLSGKTLACIFEKPSLRTRVSFEQAMRCLGGHATSLSNAEVGIGGRESPEDIARVLSSMTQGIMARVLSHTTLERMARVSGVPVINGLSDLAHPAQALADALTLMDEFAPGDPEAAGLRGRTVAFVGDGNNVARSLAVICVKLGVRFAICTPPGYELDGGWVAGVLARTAAEGAGGEGGAAAAHTPRIVACESPAEAVERADAVYCDTFVSMGQESERAQRLRVFARYQVNAQLLARAPAHAIVLHCLPASRGVEITDEVIDGPRSRVFAQARNRLDAQAGLLATLLG